MIIVVVEDDDGHADLVQEHLLEAGLHNPIMRFADGQAVLDFLFRTGSGPHRASGEAYLILLDIRMPKVDGVEVLRRMKADSDLRNIPVIMLTTTDDPREVEECYRLGCSCYITKPVEFDRFGDILKRLGLFIVVMQIPKINGEYQTHASRG